VRYVPDGSLCTVSVEQIFPRDGVQRNCFELALYIMTASPIASVRVFETAPPTLSVRDRGIIVLNHHRFWGYASGPSSSGNTLPSSIHGHAARRSALPRERFSPVALCGHRRWMVQCPLSREEQTSPFHNIASAKSISPSHVLLPRWRPGQDRPQRRRSCEQLCAR
jgi:hypothetical protein